MTLFDLSGGRDGRDAGFRLTLEGCPEEWKRQFRAELYQRAKRDAVFSSEDITHLLGLPFPEGSARNNCVGALMSGACIRGWIRCVGHNQARRPNQHATTIMLWVGCLV